MTPSSAAADGGATNTYSTTAEIRHSIRPWFEDFLSLSSFSLPLSFPELSLRFNANIHTFRGNYAIISLIVFILTLILRPIAAIVFLFLIVAWIYFFVARDTDVPLMVFDFEIGDRLVLIALSVVTIVAVAVAGVWWNLFVSILISALLVSLHAILMTPEDTDSQYGALLSVVDEDGPSRGSYMQVLLN